MAGIKVTGLKELVVKVQKAASCDAVRIALLDTYAMQRKRIFERGEASDGGAIGNISTEAGYFNPKDFPKKFPKKGKGGKTKFKDGKAHTTAYFADGYKGAKEASGRACEINMYLTGQLRNSFLPYIECGKTYAFVFTNDLSDLKAKGNEERFKKLIFDPTQAEIDNFTQKIIDNS